MLLRRLLELEVPEVARGSVEVLGIARDPGYRSKVAVISRQKGVDPIGAAVGVRGVRIQNIVNELGGERIDLIRWDPNELAFIANALSPAEVVSIRFDDSDETAYVAVPERQVSLAIGKEGQNARLAAKLTGRRIDIRSENALIEAGEDLYPPPEPNMEAIPLAEVPGLPSVAEVPLPDEVAPSQAGYARPGLPGEGAPAMPTPIEQPAAAAPEREARLTPEQEVLAELQEEPAAAEVEPAGPVAPAPQRRAPEEPGGIRFAEELGIRREDEEEQEGPARRDQDRRRRRGRGAPQRAERQPARPQRQPRRVDLGEFDEDEIEAALHGAEPEFEDELEDEFEEYEDDE
jgi:N utilization substance protein A